MKKVSTFLFLTMFISLICISLLGSTAFAETSNAQLNPSVSVSENFKIETLGFHHVTQSLLIINKDGNKLNLINNDGLLCLLDGGNIVPIRNFIIVLEDGKRIEGKIILLFEDKSRKLNEEETNKKKGTFKAVWL